MITMIAIQIAGDAIRSGHPDLIIAMMVADMMVILIICLWARGKAQRAGEIGEIADRIRATEDSMMTLEDYREVIARYQEVCGLTALLRDMYGADQLAARLQKEAYRIYVDQLMQEAEAVNAMEEGA